MESIDGALKLLLKEAANDLLRQFGIDATVEEWLPTEFALKSPRSDLVLRLSNRELWHVELQSFNDPKMPSRMLEYAVAIHRMYGRYPRQFVLYVGNERMRMDGSLDAEGIHFRYQLIDVREHDGAALAQSPNLAANVLAMLLKQRDPAAAIRGILMRASGTESRERSRLLELFLLICGVRGLKNYAIEEIKNMPVHFQLIDHEIFGPYIKQGMAEGKIEGRIEGERKLLTKLAAKRFGTLSGTVAARLESATEEQLERWGLRILDARTLEDLFD